MTVKGIICMCKGINGRTASEEVVLELIKTKCMPIYGLEACPVKKSDLNSLHFAVNRFFMKLFRTGDINIVKSCQSYYANLLCQMVK